tara:strand:+ start:14 stop:910 length:897 start_codon:yes stop_codon:yes gene_type:complete
MNDEHIDKYLELSKILYARQCDTVIKLSKLYNFDPGPYLKVLKNMIKINKMELKNDMKIIVETFNVNVRGKKYEKDLNHNCGSEGHWLEKQMGIMPNSNNEPDKLGYEQKKDSNKITFGDWRASEYIFESKKLTKDEFLRMFGSPNPKKNNRYSWSGKVFPKYSLKYNYAGQRIRFLENEDLVIEYSYLNDTREEKLSFREDFKTTEVIELARWTKCKLEKHILRKFGVKGFYICKKNKENVYDKICFGKVLDFQFFKTGLENNKIILDSGMYQGNSRYYSQFRADKSLWYELLTEEY